MRTSGIACLETCDLHSVIALLASEFCLLQHIHSNRLPKQEIVSFISQKCHPLFAHEQSGTLCRRRRGKRFFLSYVIVWYRYCQVVQDEMVF